MGGACGAPRLLGFYLISKMHTKTVQKIQKAYIKTYEKDVQMYKDIENPTGQGAFFFCTHRYNPWNWRHPHITPICFLFCISGPWTYNPLQTTLVKNLSWNHRDFHMLMQFAIQKQKGFTHGMTCHTEFHRPRAKMKGSPKCGGGGRRQLGCVAEGHAPFHFW